MDQKRAAKLAQAIALAAGALSVAACASSPPHGGHGGPGHRGGFGMAGGPRGAERPSVIVRPGALLLIDLDADHDLRVTKAEAEAGAAALFARADTNHDGTLSPLEFDALAQAHLGTSDATPGRLSFDANADNSITASEWAAGMSALFTQLDANLDGVVTRAEMVQRLEAPSDDFGGQGGGPEGGGMSGGRGGRGGRGGGRPPGGGY